LHCVEAANCAQVSFARALVSLFENEEVARASFRHVIENNPASPFASSSQLWLRLMANEETAVGGSDPVRAFLAQYVREWVERQLTDQLTSEKPAASTLMQGALEEQLGVFQRVVRVLDKQVRERDREITDLRDQLQALKLIDQDNERQRKVRPRVSLKTADQVSR